MAPSAGLNARCGRFTRSERKPGQLPSVSLMLFPVSLPGGSGVIPSSEEQEYTQTGQTGHTHTPPSSTTIHTPQHTYGRTTKTFGWESLQKSLWRATVGLTSSICLEPELEEHPAAPDAPSSTLSQRCPHTSGKPK